MEEFSDLEDVYDEESETVELEGEFTVEALEKIAGWMRLQREENIFEFLRV